MMDDVCFSPLNELPFESFFGDSILVRLAGELRLAADCGYHTDPDLAYAQAALLDSFRSTWKSIQALREYDRASA